MLKEFITDNIIIIRIMLVILLFLIINALIVSLKSDKLEDRIKKYSVKSIVGNEKSFMDLFYKMIYMLINKMSTLLIKFKVFKKYSRKYDKYINTSSKNRKNIDFLAFKIIFLLLLLLINTLRLLYFNVSLESYLIIILVGYYLPDVFLYFRYRNKIIKNEKNILAAIDIISESLKNKSNMNLALENAISFLEDPIKEEFIKILNDYSYGLNIEKCFSRLNNRVNTDLTNKISYLLNYYLKSSTNYSEIFNLLNDNLINDEKIKKETNYLTTTSRWLANINKVIPLSVFFGIIIYDNNYYKKVFLNWLGILIFLGIILVYIVYLFILNKIMKVN